MKQKILLDSHFLIYPFVENSPFTELTRKLFENVSKNEANFYVAQQNILEAEHTLIARYKQDKEMVLTSIEAMLIDFELSIITPLPSTLSLFHKLIRQAESISQAQIFDYFLAATALSNEVSTLYTLNSNDFEAIYGLQVVVPS